ncbi:RNA polymerase sigma factor RpoD/SigA [Methylomicrobium lacus]|uniref:sigma-70 family RNA polymerase sigma factor n=1 Tax=Methylomicrobium lacus TaxID=136992 RepID=UPI0035A898D2
MAVTLVEKYPSVSREDIDPESSNALLDRMPDFAECAGIDAEDPNLSLARRLKACKMNLVNALAQSSLTPLWLLQEHEQHLDKEAADPLEEPKSSTELASPLALIRQCYQRVTVEKAAGEVERNAEDMVAALQCFPFTFNDLTRLVDLHGYAGRHLQQENAQVRERIARITQCGAKHKNDGFAQILQLHRQHLGRPLGFFFTGQGSRYSLAELIAAERAWLESRQQLVTANSGLVLYIANQYKGSFLDFEDMVQEGQTGLLKAADRYDYRLGFKFSTYAGYWIRQAISRALSRSERVVRIPCGQVGAINKFFRDREQLLVRTGKEPSLQDLAEHTGLSPAEIDAILAISQTAVPIESSSDDDDEAFAPIDFLEQDIFASAFGILAQSDLARLIGQALKILNPREAKIICDHFGVDSERELTLKEIGLELNLTRERVRQIEVGALNKIKRHYGEHLSSFL